MCSTGRWRCGSSFRACSAASERCRAPVPDSENRMGAADVRIPVADLHRIPAVPRDAGAVHRELAGSAPRPDHDIRRSGFAAADAADPQRDRGASRRLPADGDHDQYRASASRPASSARLAGMPNPAGLGALAATLNFIPDHRPRCDVRRPDGGRHRRVPDARRRAGRAGGLCRAYLSRRPFRHPDHHRPPARSSTRWPCSSRSRSGPGCGDRWAPFCRRRS